MRVGEKRREMSFVLAFLFLTFATFAWPLRNPDKFPFLDNCESLAEMIMVPLYLLLQKIYHIWSFLDLCEQIYRCCKTQNITVYRYYGAWFTRNNDPNIYALIFGKTSCHLCRVYAALVLCQRNPCIGFLYRLQSFLRRSLCDHLNAMVLWT